MGPIEELYAQLGWEITGEDKLRRFKAGMTEATRGLAEFAAKAAAFGVAAATAIGTGAALLGKSILDVGAEFENLEIRLTSLEGSQEKAKKAMDWVRQFAKETPLSLQEAASSYAKLKGFGIDPMNGSLRSLTDMMAKTGGKADQLDGIIVALGQAWTKTKLQAEEMNQLIERGVPAWDLLSKATGKTGAQLMEMASKGKLGRREIQLLMDQIGKDAAGASLAASKSWTGIIDRFGDTWEQFAGKVADAGFFEWAKKQVTDFADLIDGLDKSGKLDELATGISNAFVTAGEEIKSLFRDLKPSDVTDFVTGTLSFLTSIVRMIKGIGAAMKAVGRFVADLLGLKDTWQGIVITLAGVGLLVAPWATAFAAMTLVIDDFMTYLRGGDSLTGDFVDSVKNQFKRFAPAVTRYWNDFLSIFKKTPVFRFVEGALNRLKQIDFGGLMKSWKETGQGLWTGIKDLGQGLWDVGKALASLVSGDASSDIGKIAEQLGQLAGSAIVAGLEGLEGTVKLIANAFSTIGKVLSRLAQGDLKGAFDEWAEGVKRAAGIVVQTIENMIKAFLPDFSFVKAWDKVTEKFNSIATAIETAAQRIKTALANVIPEPPAWWRDATEKYQQAQNVSDAGAAIGAMVPPSNAAPVAPAEPSVWDRIKADLLKPIGQIDKSTANDNLKAWQNFNGNSQRVAPDAALQQVKQDVTDNRQDNRDQSTNVGPVSVVVNGVQGVSEAVGRQVGSAVQGGAAKGASASRPARIEGSN